MDPDEALKRIRALYDADHDSYTAEELIDLIQGLDEWLSRGGFLPKAWIGTADER